MLRINPAPQTPEFLRLILHVKGLALKGLYLPHSCTQVVQNRLLELSRITFAVVKGLRAAIGVGDGFGDGVSDGDGVGWVKRMIYPGVRANVDGRSNKCLRSQNIA